MGKSNSTVGIPHAWKYRHGMCDSAEYNAWAAMIQRCHNPNNPNFKNYGGRGISVSDRWRAGFSNFLHDMGVKPSSRHTLERVNNNEGYCAENCMWVTRKEQQKNTRSNRWITINGQRKTESDWAREKGIHSTTISHRIARGMSESEAVLVEPKLCGRRVSQCKLESSEPRLR